MKTTNVALYALRVGFGQVTEVSSTSSAPNKVVTRSAAMLAAFGIALSSFSLKQMLNSSQTATRKL